MKCKAIFTYLWKENLWKFDEGKINSKINTADDICGGHYCSLPDVDTPGPITHDLDAKVMGLEANEKVLVSWVTNDGKQNWTISQLDATDYFTLKNQATGLLLFSNKENKPTNGPPPIPDSNYLKMLF